MAQAQPLSQELSLKILHITACQDRVACPCPRDLGRRLITGPLATASDGFRVAGPIPGTETSVAGLVWAAPDTPARQAAAGPAPRCRAPPCFVSRHSGTADVTSGPGGATLLPTAAPSVWPVVGGHVLSPLARLAGAPQGAGVGQAAGGIPAQSTRRPGRPEPDPAPLPAGIRGPRSRLRSGHSGRSRNIEFSILGKSRTKLRTTTMFCGKKTERQPLTKKGFTGQS